MKINETGRSMIEMLGVLAIVGVLSVGGVAGYSKAMVKAKVNKTIDLLVETTANVHHAFLKKTTNYSSLTTTYAIAHNLVPDNYLENTSEKMDLSNMSNSDLAKLLSEKYGTTGGVYDGIFEDVLEYGGTHGSCAKAAVCMLISGQANSMKEAWSKQSSDAASFKSCYNNDDSASSVKNYLVNNVNLSSTDASFVNPFGGDAEIYGTGNYFAIALDGIPKGACVELVDQNWESVDAFSGMVINEEVVTATGTSSATVTTSSSSTSSSNNVLYCEDSNEVVFYFK